MRVFGDSMLLTPHCFVDKVLKFSEDPFLPEYD